MGLDGIRYKYESVELGPINFDLPSLGYFFEDFRLHNILRLKPIVSLL